MILRSIVSAEEVAVSFIRALVVVATVAMGAVAGVAIGTVGDTANAAPALAPASVIDRSYVCATAFLGGIRQLEARAHSGSRAHSEWTRLPYAVVASGGVARTPFVDAPPENSLAWVTAGQPSLATTIDEEWLSFTPRSGGTIGVNRELCSPATRRVALAKVGLPGGSVGSRAVRFACEVPRRVLIRLSAVVNGGTALRERGRLFRATNAPARLAKLVVATPAGKVLTYAEVSDSGQARLFTAKSCTPD